MNKNEFTPHRVQILNFASDYEMVPFNSQDHDLSLDPDTQKMMSDDVLRHRWDWIVQQIAAGIFVSGPQLARSLDEAPGAPLPPLVARYLAALLRREITRKTGRKPASDVEIAILGIADRDYRWFLHQIKRMGRRQNSILTARWVREAEWFRQAPADLAIVMVKHRHYSNLTEETVKAMLSRYRNGHR